VFSCARADINQFGCGKLGKLSASEFLVAQIAANQSCVRLANLNEQLPRTVVRYTREVEASVRFSVTE
jgi:hypothetical protein